MSHLIHQLPLQVKHPSMIAEFFQLTDRTRAIVLFVSTLLAGKYNRLSVWTEFYRTQDQQNLYYQKEIDSGLFVERDGKKLYSKDKRRPTISVHQLYRGADLSRRNLSDGIIEAVTETVNKVFPYGKEQYNTALFHQQYGQSHFHFQSMM